MTGTVLGSKMTTVDLASYSTGNPFTVGAATSISTTTGVAIYGSAVNSWTLSNSGHISGYSGGVTFADGGSVTNATATSTVSGGPFSTHIDGGLGFVTNSGTISGSLSGSGVGLSLGGSVTNSASGSIFGKDTGIDITGAAGTVSNAGEIEAMVTGVELLKVVAS